MASVGTAAAGKTLIGNGIGASPTFKDIGTNSGLTNHGALIAQGNGAFVASAVGTNGQVFLGATGANPAFGTLASSDGSIAFTSGPNSLNLTVASGSTVGKTITGTTGGALSPTSGNWNILAASTAAGTTPIATAGSGSTLTINVQKAQAIAATDATKVGLCNFDSAKFSVDANGFVTTSGTGVANTITGDSGGALSPTSGNWNLLGSGSIATSGSGSTLTTALTGLTNHNVLIGAGTSTITKVAPSATSGVPLISQGASADPVFGTTAIAGGGTNATSMSTSTGIVKYDGTSLVTSSTALIDSSNRYTNTSQPAFLAYLATTDSNVTGDGTNYRLGSGNALTEVFDQGSNFNTNGTFTAPITGRYPLQCSCWVQGGTSITGATLSITTSNRTYTISQSVTGSLGFFMSCLSCTADMDAADTATVNIVTSDTGGKVDDVLGSSTLYNFFSGFLAL